MTKKLSSTSNISSEPTLKARSAVDVSNTWDLNPMYADISLWRKDMERVRKEAPLVLDYQGKLRESAKNISGAFYKYLELSRLLEKIYTYAHLLSDQDTGNSSHLALLDEALSLYTEFSATTSFLVPELLTIEEAVISKFLLQPELAPLKRFLLDIIRYKSHTLSKEEEAIIANGMELYGSSEKIFSQLTNADFSFESVNVDGRSVELSHGMYALLLKHQDRNVRRETYQKYYKQYRGHKHSIAASLSSSIKKDLFFTRIRKHSSTIERSLFTDNVKSQVYENLIETVSNNLAPLHKYYALRKKLLNLEELRIYDTYVPLVAEVKEKTPYNEAVRLVVDSLAPLGEEYTEVLRKGLTTDRWVDKFENKGKRSGAYSSGCYDSFPYILLNYREDDINSIFTLTHEAGHSMHSYFSRIHQSYQDHSYTIFVAEVASIFNEELLLKHLRHIHQNDKRMLAFLINHEIDEIKGTLFRQTMFAEFERTIHGKASAGEPLTVDTFQEIYASLLAKYFGAAVALGEDDPLECLRIPHFYSSFYVYKYATGISAAISLAQQVLQGGETDRKRYLQFLGAGCTKYPLELLLEAGVDMRKPDAVVRATKHFESLVDSLEAALT